MRAFSYSPVSGMPHIPQPVFFPFGPDALAQARARGVPLLLLIGYDFRWESDPSLCMQIAERTVPVRLYPGERPDLELLCQRAGMLTSGEGMLPLCALLTHDGLPFLAAPLPPPGFALDPSRLYVWLSHADRRFAQNTPACTQQAAQVIRSFRTAPCTKPYTPGDAAHDLARALLSIEDTHSGGFGGAKSPFVCGLRFARHAAERGDKALHRALNRALDAMLSSSVYDPLDGLFFSAALSDDWRVFVPEKPLAVNAMLAPILMASGRRSEAIRLLDALMGAFALPEGALACALHAPRSTYAFTPEQACAALGSEDGLRACRLLGLLRQQTRSDPAVTPSRFSPIPSDAPHGLNDEPDARCPTLPVQLTPEDAAFLRRALPLLLRTRAARTPETPPNVVITEHCALAAAVLAACGRRLGEARYTQAAQRAVSFLMNQPPVSREGLPASIVPAAALHAQAACGASAALALAQLALGQSPGMEEYAQSGLRLLGAALHAFVREDGLAMHTPRDHAPCPARVPAIYDSELPSPAAQLAQCLRIAHALRPQAGYDQALDALWHAAAPAVKAQPLACASLIDVMTEIQ